MRGRTDLALRAALVLAGVGLFICLGLALGRVAWWVALHLYFG